MQIRVLGCHGSHTPGCNTTSFLLNENILVDAGTITSSLSIEEQVKINYVLITHAHLDHVRDIMFLADNMCYLQQDHPLVVVATHTIIDTLKTYLFNNIIWPDFSSLPNPENPVLQFKTIKPGEKVVLDTINVTAVLVNHVIETVSYAIESQEGSIVIIGDTGPTEDVWNVANNISNLKAVFVETSLPNDMRDVANMTGHLTASGLEEELKKLNTRNPQIYLYHMKFQYHESIQNEIAMIKDRNIRILQDGEVIHI
ncbi:MAG TPA: MBL fold metallo-hydrolase [Syntrophaceae bacterium]|jgi:cAMP phosphodiesterase|nr:MBL fold metallo-hydrolase [Syntrophaceae bacterium]